MTNSFEYNTADHLGGANNYSNMAKADFKGNIAVNNDIYDPKSGMGGLTDS
jgi:hypothetical protein